MGQPGVDVAKKHEIAARRLIKLNPVANWSVLESMDGVSTLLHEFDNRVAVFAERAFSLAVVAQLLESETVRGVRRLLGVWSANK
jgi:hypothetical protein